MKSLLFTLMLFIAFNNFAQSPQTLIDNLQNKFKSIEDFKSDFKQTTNGSFSENDLTLIGRFYYKKSNKFNVSLKNISLISDGSSIWNYDKRLNRVVINNIDEKTAFLNLDNIINKYPELCKVSEVKNHNENKFYILNLVPNNKNLEFDSAKIWIDKNYILNKVEIIDSNGSVYFIELSNIKLNQKLSDDYFGFIIPEGCKLIDFR